VVVIGTHFEKLTFGVPGNQVDFVSQDELNTILTEEQDGFRKDEVDKINSGKADYWENYEQPVFKPVRNDVELYRVAYRSTIPEQGNRPTVAYGLVAIPKGATGNLPLVSYQHGTLFMKQSAPSQAFSWDKTSMAPAAFGLPEAAMYASAYETRLNVAQFAGHGYAVIAADYFGQGNSVENDGFFVKGSSQQANLDMHAAAQKLLASQNLAANKLFLNGWSQGGLVTVAFQEALEARQMKIDGVSTAAAPPNTELLINRLLFDPRPYSTTSTPDAEWIVMIPQLAAFSLGGYGGKPGTALELFGGNYDFARKFYMREFTSFPEFTFQEDVRGGMVPVMTMDGVTRLAAPAEFIVQRFGQDPQAFATTAFAGLMRDAGAGKTRLESKMKMFYGAADEASPEIVGSFVPTWQRDTFGKNNIEDEAVPFASHRGTFLDATYVQLKWFDDIRFDRLAPGVGSPNPVTGVPAAVVNLTAKPTGIGEALLDWKPSAGATSYTIKVDDGRPDYVVEEGSAWGIGNLNPLLRYTFTVVPNNSFGSGPETTVVLGGAMVDIKVDSWPGTSSTTGFTLGQDDSIWSFVRSGGLRQVQQFIQGQDGTWSAAGPAITLPGFPVAMVTGLDGSLWVRCGMRQVSSGGGVSNWEGENGVAQITKDNNGIWGIHRFIYSSDSIDAMTVGSDGSIWYTADGWVKHSVKGQDGQWRSAPVRLAAYTDTADSKMTTGLDGSIWVSVYEGNNVQRVVPDSEGGGVLYQFGDRDSLPFSRPHALTTGLDGSIWVATEGEPLPEGGLTPYRLQRIVNENDTWSVKDQAIDVDGRTDQLTTGLDGSIWIWSFNYNGDAMVQQVVNQGDRWSVKGPAIPVVKQSDSLNPFINPQAITTARDGSIWVMRQSVVRQLFSSPVAPTDLAGSYDLAAGRLTLTGKSPVTDGGTPVLYYTATASQGTTTQTLSLPAGDSADAVGGSPTGQFVFNGLDPKKGPVTLTMTATNYAGTSSAATLVLGGVPSAVPNLTVTSVDIGRVNLAWSPSPVETRYTDATSYTIKVSDGRPDVVVAEGEAWVVRELNQKTRYTFTVVPNNPFGSGPETRIEFGEATVDYGFPPIDAISSKVATAGLDGSIWVAIASANQVGQGGTVQQLIPVNGQWSAQEPIRLLESPSAMTTGVDGTIWLAYHAGGTGHVRRIGKGQDGTWGFQGQAISVDDKPSALTAGTDGSIWVASSDFGTVQRIIQGQDGNWFVAGPAIPVDKSPSALTTGKDGSIWVASRDFGTVQQIVKDQNGTWGVRQFGDKPSIAVDKSPSALTAGLDGSIWVASSGFGTVQQIVQDQNGNWGVRQFGDRASIAVDNSPSALATGKDGSIWVTSFDYGTAQKIVNQGGNWSVEGRAIQVGDFPNSITIHPDGSIWVPGRTSARQILDISAPPSDLVGNFDTATGRVTLTAKAPMGTGGMPVLYYTAEARQGTTIWDATIKTIRIPASGNAATVGGSPIGPVVFEGFDPKRGGVFITLTATTFVDTSLAATLAVGDPPAAVQDLKMTTVDIGKVTLSWQPSYGATSYTVQVSDGRQDSLVLQGSSIDFDNLSPTTKYTFTVVPKNAAGNGATTRIEFGPNKVGTIQNYERSTVGLDGSIWVLQAGDNAAVQQLVNVNGTWTAQTPIQVDKKPSALTTGLDGSIWVASEEYSTVQQIVKDANGNWGVRRFGDRPSIAVDERPSALTTGLDGSIWVASVQFGTVQQIVQGQDGNWFVAGPAISVDIGPVALTTGKDGSIWVACINTLGDDIWNRGSVQRIVQGQDGKWFVQGQAIQVDPAPRALTTALDGSIWVACQPGGKDTWGSVQHIVNENGNWFVKGQAIQVDSFPRSLTTGHDGSIWVGSRHSNSVQRIVTERGASFVKGEPNHAGYQPITGLDGSIWVMGDNLATQFWTNPPPPTDLVGSYDLAAGRVTLTVKPPKTDGGTPVGRYTATAWQGTTSQTSSSTTGSFTFNNLDPKKGPVYFTVTATNFIGTSPVATLLLGQDGTPIDTTHLTTGITTDGTPVIGGGFDSVGNTYSWEALGSGAGVSNGKATFNFGLPNQPQAFVAAGQEIAVQQGNYRSVNLAGAAVYYGAQPNVTFKLNYTDGTSENWTQSISDWANPQRYNGETTLITSQYRNQGDGTKDSRSVYLYSYSRAIPQGKTLKSITLPLNQSVRILDVEMGT
jgi:hypothetical protein